MTTVFLVFTDALGPFLGINSSKGAETVVTNHQYLPTLCSEGALHLEGTGSLDTKGVLGLSMMNRNTANMKNIFMSVQMILRHRLANIDVNRNSMDKP